MTVQANETVKVKHLSFQCHGNLLETILMKMTMPLDTFCFLFSVTFVTESSKPFQRLVYFNMRKVACPNTNIFI